MATRVGVIAPPPAVSSDERRRRPRKISVEFVEDALDALVDGAERSGMSNGDFPVEAVRAVAALSHWEDEGYSIIARRPDGREFVLTPVLYGLQPPMV